jgi:glycosyltransferase involved in cell wall biosynthesis
VIAAAAARTAGVPITFVGDGPAAAEIRAENADAELLGWRPREEIAALLQGRTKAVVAPSQWLETGPLTVYEAAAAGVASIVSDRCGAAERVDHEVSGLVVEPTVDGVADALRRLNDATIARRFGETAYKQYWARPPTPDAHARALIALYAEILGRPE